MLGVDLPIDASFLAASPSMPGILSMSRSAPLARTRAKASSNGMGACAGFLVQLASRSAALMMRFSSVLAVIFRLAASGMSMAATGGSIAAAAASPMGWTATPRRPSQVPSSPASLVSPASSASAWRSRAVEMVSLSTTGATSTGLA